MDGCQATVESNVLSHVDDAGNGQHDRDIRMCPNNDC